MAIITGGSRGLGLEIARKLGSRGAKLALVARDPEELHRAKQELKSLSYDVLTLPYDVTDPAQAAAAIEKVQSHYGKVDILINNAGQITVGPFELFDAGDFEASLAIHLMAPLHLIKAALPALREASRARIVKIASIGGKIGVPHLSPYCASKFALVGLSKTLRAELAADRISVTTVCPGLMRTGSHWNARFKGQREKEFAWFAHGASLPGISMSASRAAQQIVEAMSRRQAELVISIQANAAVIADATTPGIVALVSSLVCRFLPGMPTHGGRRSRTGWHARSKWVPSIFTRLGDRAAADNNEVGNKESPAK